MHALERYAAAPSWRADVFCHFAASMAIIGRPNESMLRYASSTHSMQAYRWTSVPLEHSQKGARGRHHVRPLCSSQGRKAFHRTLRPLNERVDNVQRGTLKKRLVASRFLAEKKRKCSKKGRNGLTAPDLATLALAGS